MFKYLRKLNAISFSKKKKKKKKKKTLDFNKVYKKKQRNFKERVSEASHSSPDEKS